MMRHAKVTLTLREEDARALLRSVKYASIGDFMLDQRIRIVDEIRHALAECDCGEETR